MSETPEVPQLDKVIEVADLTKVFKDFWGRSKVKALDGVSIDIRRGEIFGLVGPNGSGKTTFIKILLGLLFPTGGKVNIFGENAFRTLNKLRIGFLPEANYFYEHLSGRETLNFYAKLLSLKKAQRKERIDELLELTGLAQAANRTIGEYSSGMKRRIAMAQALLADPELLILDEPTSGLDPIGVEEVQSLIFNLKKRGKTILLCSHLLSEMEEVCDRVAILFQGKLLAYGQLGEILSEEGSVLEHKGSAAQLEKIMGLARAEGIELEAHPKRGSLKERFRALIDEAVDKSTPKQSEKQNEEENQDSLGPDDKPDEDYIQSLSKSS